MIEKRIHELVKSLNIQTDNLVQFLPQDKVHDFSKMNSKELLVRTVDAVGDVELRADHEKYVFFIFSRIGIQILVTTTYFNAHAG